MFFRHPQLRLRDYSGAIQALITHVGEIDMSPVLTTKENVPGTCDSACTMAHFLTTVILVVRITIY